MRRLDLHIIPLALVTAASLFASAPAFPQTVSTFASGVTAARSLAVDSSGRLYCSQRTLGAIVRCTPPSNVMTTFATGLGDPIDMVFDDSGNLFVVDFDNGSSNGHIYKITPAGTKTIYKSIVGYGPLSRDAAGNLYVGRPFFQSILKITAAGDTSTYVPFVGDAGARLSMVHMDSDGTLYAGTEHGFLYKIGPGGSPVTTVCSGLTNVFGFERAGDGNWYVSTYAGDRIWQVTPGGIATPFSGAEGVTALVNGPVVTARFNRPVGMVTLGGQMYIADYFNNAIRAIDWPTPATPGSWGGVKARYRR